MILMAIEMLTDLMRHSEIDFYFQMLRGKDSLTQRQTATDYQKEIEMH